MSTDMTYIAALQRVLPGLDWKLACPPRTAYWSSGDRPPETLAIDDQVKDLKTRRDENNHQECRLRSEDQLRQSFVDDPFLVAREFIARGVEAGRMAKERDRQAKSIRDELKHDLDRQKRRIDLLEKLIEESPGDGPQAEHTSSDHEMTLEDKATFLLSEAKSRYEKRMEQTQGQIERFSPSTKNVWLQAFIHQMGEAWHLLTGRTPSSMSDRFIEFTKAALSAVIETYPDEDIEHQVRQVVTSAKGSEANRFDRYSKPAPAFDRRLSFLTGKMIHRASETDTILCGENDRLPPWSGEIRRRDHEIIAMVRDLAGTLADPGKASEGAALTRLTIKSLVGQSSAEGRLFLGRKLKDAGVDVDT